MSEQLTVTVGQFTSKGHKEINQDFHGWFQPQAPSELAAKGIAFAIADGISTSSVSHIASETAVKNFLLDYFCTSEAWSVPHAANKVISAINGWLYSQSRNSQYRYEKDKGYVCTFSALVLKGQTAHLFHIGDSRIYRLQGNALEQLTNDHRLTISEHESYLSKALGVEALCETDHRVLSLKPEIRSC